MVKRSKEISRKDRKNWEAFARTKYTEQKKKKHLLDFFRKWARQD